MSNPTTSKLDDIIMNLWIVDATEVKFTDVVPKAKADIKELLVGLINDSLFYNKRTARRIIDEQMLTELIEHL